MSVNITHYLGIGYKLDYDKHSEKIKTFLNAHPEFSQYSFLNPNNNGGLQIILNDEYVYIMYVLQRTEQEDMYSDIGNVEFSLLNANPKASPAISVRELYYNVTGDSPDDPEIISFFH